MEMDYPSTTQALFALIVMVIVLTFILVYCCWGTFSCSQSTEVADGDVEGGRQSGSESINSSSTLFILPYRNMIYIGDGQTRQVYQIPIRDDKPPSYRDIFNNLLPPPSYNGSLMIPNAEDMPPTYEDCVRAAEEIRSSGLLNETLNREGMMTSRSSLPPCHRHISYSTSRQGLSESSNARSKRRNSLTSVFRARSLLTGITLNSSTLAQTFRFQGTPRLPLSVSNTSSDCRALPPFTESPVHKSLGSFTTSSSPCLPIASGSSQKYK